MRQRRHSILTRVLEHVLRREGVILAGGLGALTVLAWTYLLGWGMSPAMPGVMPGMAMTQMLRPWTVGEFSLGFAMWSAMTVGMMTPSIAPAILMHARVDHDRLRNAPLAPVGWFVGGYLIAWLGYALLASLAQAAFLEAGLITPALRSSGAVFGGTVFILAGGYQLSLLKDACLTYCRSPASFIHGQGGFGSSIGASLRLGLKHGLYCVGCCWGLMALLFAVGVTELVWMAVTAIWIMLEKIFPRPGVMTRLSGFGLLAAGILSLAMT